MRSPRAVIDDGDLRDAVIDALNWDPQVDSKRIRVDARDGAVSLTGFVPSHGQKETAVRAAQHVWGVKAVADDLDVALAPSVEKEDAEIAREIARERSVNTLFPDSVAAEVRNGHVTLRGEVELSSERDETLRAVRHLVGVLGVTNLITVAPDAGSDPES